MFYYWWVWFYQEDTEGPHELSWTEPVHVPKCLELRIRRISLLQLEQERTSNLIEKQRVRNLMAPEAIIKRCQRSLGAFGHWCTMFPLAYFV